MVKQTGGMELTACTIADVENNSLFVDSSDNTLKYKDNTGTLHTIDITEII
jgi:hypothetical protein